MRREYLPSRRETPNAHAVTRFNVDWLVNRIHSHRAENASSKNFGKFHYCARYARTVLIATKITVHIGTCGWFCRDIVAGSILETMHRVQLVIRAVNTLETREIKFVDVCKPTWSVIYFQFEVCAAIYHSDALPATWPSVTGASKLLEDNCNRKVSKFHPEN